MIVTLVIVMVLTVNSDYEIMNLIMAIDYDQHDNDGDSDFVDTDPIAAISVPGIPTAVLVPVTGEVLCPVVPSFINNK